MAILAQFLKNEHGATAIEYALIASIIVLVIVAGVRLVGAQVSAVFTEVGHLLNEATVRGVSKRGGAAPRPAKSPSPAWARRA
jgi:pilus assembly protein Flp/PilA